MCPGGTADLLGDCEMLPPVSVTAPIKGDNTHPSLSPGPGIVVTAADVVDIIGDTIKLSSVRLAGGERESFSVFEASHENGLEHLERNENDRKDRMKYE